MGLRDFFTNKRVVTEMQQLREEVKSLKEKRSREDQYTTWETYFKPYTKGEERFLLPHEYRKIYRSSSTVRPSVDAIIRQVASQAYSIPTKDSALDSETDLRKEIIHFFDSPNSFETLRDLLNKFILDLLVLDAGVFVKDRNVYGKLLEMRTLDSSEITPVLDKYGILLGYNKTTPEVPFSSKPTFDYSDIIYLMQYPRSYSGTGTPIIDSILTEVALLFREGKGLLKDAKEGIPPGILNVGPIGEPAYRRLKADFEESGGEKTSRIKVIRSEVANWLEFKGAAQTENVLKVNDKIEKIVFRNFGLSPAEMGEAEHIPRAVMREATLQTESTLKRPISSLIEVAFTKKIIEEEFGAKNLRFAFITPTIKESYSVRVKAQRQAVTSGFKTINQVRAEEGQPPFPGGDRAFILVGKEITFIDQLGKEKISKGDQ